MKNTHTLSSLLFIVLIAACLVSLVAGYFVINLPGRAERAFGPASPQLSPWEHLRLSAFLLWYGHDLTTPRDPFGEEQAFKVELGESTVAIIARLWDTGLITNPAAFIMYLQYSGLDATLQAGQFKLSPAMTSIQIAKTMQDATPSEVSFRILEGWRLEEIAASLPTSGLNITPEEFLKETQAFPAGYTFSDQAPEHASLEGFLLPDSYTLPRDLTTYQLLAVFLNNFDAKVPAEIRDGFTQQGLTLYQGVTLASIVQREALRDEEKSMIASVFLNRLAAGMRLEADPTVQYSLGNQLERGGWWPVPLSSQDLQIESAYNTYVYPGLPPGPIANPGLTSLRAVAFPAQTEYYYFRAACDASRLHVFAATLEQHIQNACP